MFHVAICDDRLDQIDIIYQECMKYFIQKNICVEISKFNTPMSFIDDLEKNGGYDIALLDICMPGMSGIDIAKEIRLRKDKTEIVFLTTSDEFAMDAFSVDARHYILKPIKSVEFSNAMDRILEKFSINSNKKIIVNGESGNVYSVNINDVIYIESVRNARIVYTNNSSYKETKYTLSAMLEKLESLSPSQFITPYRGYIINLNYVVSVNPNGINLKNDVFIPIKSGQFRIIKDSLFDWSFNKKEGI